MGVVSYFGPLQVALKTTLLPPLCLPVTPLPALKVLDLHDNAFLGQLPDWLPLLPLLSLSLGYNMFTGTLPSAMTCAPLLQLLDVEGNRLTGTIPEFCVGLLEVGITCGAVNTLISLPAMARI
jgi:hypothetical protein